jgi:hypothetical protein
MLANIYLRKNSSIPVKWQGDLLSKENLKRDVYIQAIKSTNNGDYQLLIEMHKITYCCFFILTESFLLEIKRYI